MRAWLDITVAFEERTVTLKGKDGTSRRPGLTRATLTEFDYRIASMDRSLAELVAGYASRGETYSQESAAMVNAVLNAVAQFGAQATRWIDALPDTTLRDALSMIKRSH